MSGPITVSFTFGLEFGALLLAQQALLEARAMKREYGDALVQVRAREAELARTRAGQQAARLERIAATRREVELQVGRWKRLRALSGDVPALAARVDQPMPAAPAGDDDAAWSQYLHALSSAADALQTLLAQAGGPVGEDVLRALASTASAPTIHDVLSAYVLERQRKPGLDPAQTAQFRETAARVLGRLQLAAGDAVPAELEALARSIVLSPTAERAEALASELRLAVQRHRDALTAQREEAQEARRLLGELPEDAPALLTQALERVAAGVERMDATLRKSVQDVLDTAAADRAAREQEAAAYVLEQSLRDLGYEVEDIEATLFAGGGTVHFRRAGWDNYFVRMRIDPHERTANFNVVRARGDEDTAERRRLDALAEDRWCAEFPRLMETLAARGLSMEVTRRLGAGEVPVQVVDGAGLPAVHAAEAARPRGAPLARRPR